MAQRTRLSPDRRRTQLVELGLDLLSTRTLDELSIEDIASAAGISTGLLFHYFGSKREFHLAVAKAAAKRLLDCINPDPELPPGPRTRKSLEAFVDHVSEYPEAYVSLVRGGSTSDTTMQSLFDSTRGAIAQQVLDNIAELGIDTTPLLAIAMRGWVALAEEATVTWMRGQEAEPPVGVPKAICRTDLLDLLERSFYQVVMVALGPEVVAPWLPELFD